MALQVNIHDILGQLYQHRDLVSHLFANRERVTLQELLATGSLNQDQYLKLKSLDLIYDYEGIISLNDAVVSMFEEFMEIGEVTPGLVRDYMNELQRQLIFYNDLREQRFLRGVKKYLKRIDVSLSREIIKLQKNVDDTYKNESNYRVKIQKLEDYREKRDTIIEFIKKTHILIDTNRKLFNLSNDSELFGIVSALKHSLIENLDYLIEIQTDITDYINKIQLQLDSYLKAQQLKEIKDRGQLYYQTNFKNTVALVSSLRHNNVKSPRTRISVNSLFTDEGHILCQKIAEKYKLSRLLSRGIADKLSGNYKEKALEQQIKLDTERLVDRFLKQDKQNLFLYLIDYKFPKAIGDVGLEDRLSLFVEIAMEYQTQMDFKYRLEYYKYTDSEQKQKTIGYTLIVPPNSKKQKKTTLIKTA